MKIEGSGVDRARWTGGAAPEGKSAFLATAQPLPLHAVDTALAPPEDGLSLSEATLRSTPPEEAAGSTHTSQPALHPSHVRARHTAPLHAAEHGVAEVQADGTLVAGTSRGTSVPSALSMLDEAMHAAQAAEQARAEASSASRPQVAPAAARQAPATLDVAPAAPSASATPSAATLPTRSSEPTPAPSAAVAPAQGPSTSAASRPGLVTRVVSSTMQGLRKMGNQFMTLIGRGDDTRPLRGSLAAINQLGPQLKQLSDQQLQAKTAEFKARIAAGESLESLTPEAFAVAREAADRVLHMRPFDSQVLGGLAMNTGAIAQMGTGEGKTLTATMPVYLNALSGKGAHVVTVNETLAKRDAEQMSPLYKFLGLSTGIVTEDMTPEQKRNAYNCDITYTTNTSLGFDFLRDNMAHRKEDVVCREPNFALVDEVDEVLIDEARTPLIISELSEPSTKEYQTMARVVSTLEPGTDFKVDLKQRQTWLTDEGLTKVEKQLGVDNLYAPENLSQVHYLRAALVARNLFVKDKDYVVNDGKIDIVDEFTGRIMDGRRYNDGIHQALEAKEGVEVQPEQRTLASITYPNLFRRYHKLCGMSGTAKTEESEFLDLYNLPVAVMPPNKPSQRIDQPDMVYKTYQEKFKAVADYVERNYQEGKPVLIGTRNIVINEYLDKLLNARGIPHQVLNAKNVKDNTEAENAILAQAGKSGMVTLATNMAGRGVDIKPDYINFKKLTLESVEHLQKGEKVVITVPKAENAADVRLWLGCNQVAVAEATPTLSDFTSGRTRGLFAAAAGADGQAVAPQVQVLVDDRKGDARQAPLPSVGAGVAVLDGSAPEFATGGLHVVGTERHESRRIDDQLKGRAARQGNPGETQFFVSLDDELMRLFGSDRLKKVFDGLGVKDGQAVQDSMLNKAIESAQKKVEDMNFEARKNTTKYDQVLNTQRDLMYADRKALLDGSNVKDQLSGWTSDAVDRAFQSNQVTGGKATAEEARAVWTELVEELGVSATPAPEAMSVPGKVDAKALRQQIETRVADLLAAKEKSLGSEGFADVLRETSLNSLDEAWFNHLDDLQELQGGIGLVAYAEQDPWVAYQKRAFELWQDMKIDVESRVVREALAAQPPQPLAPGMFMIPPDALQTLMGGAAPSVPSTMPVAPQQS